MGRPPFFQDSVVGGYSKTGLGNLLKTAFGILDSGAQRFFRFIEKFALDKFFGFFDSLVQLDCANHRFKGVSE